MPQNRVWQSLTLPSGVVKSESDYSQEGRYIDSDKVRFVRGLPESMGGFAHIDATMSWVGVCRGLLPWIDNNEAKRIIFGTHRRLYLWRSSGIKNITPIRISGTLTSAFSTTNGSAVVTVAHVGHGLINGTFVNFTNGTAIGSSGITLSGDYEVTVTGANDYTVTHGSTASSDETNAGDADYKYEINPGLVDVTPGFGYGVGTYGTGFYGTPRSSSITLNARTWTTDLIGEDPVVCPRGGSIYTWDASTDAAQATIVSNAPTLNQAIFVTAERHLVALGADGDGMTVKWSDDTDLTDWTPSASNDAGSMKLAGGHRLIAGKRMRNRINLAWSDTDCFVMRYTGDQFVFGFDRQGTNAGLIAPHAAVEFEGVAYWLSKSGFNLWNGYVQPMPNSLDVRDFVLDNINLDQLDKVHAGTIAKHGEIIFLYCANGSTEINRYVVYSIREQVWTVGTYVRTAWVDNGVYSYPVASNASDDLYFHENGEDADGAALEKFVKSAPLDIGEGDRLMDMFGYVPDLVSQTGTVNLELFQKNKPQASETTLGPYAITTSTEDIHFRVSARQMAFKLTSNETGGKFRLGKPRVIVQPAGYRR